jgi:hypothetical protein
MEAGISMVPPAGYHAAVESTEAERAALGTSLLEVSTDWKRILSPMLTFAVAQDALLLAHRDCYAPPPLVASPLPVEASSPLASPRDGHAPSSLRAALTPARKEVFGELLAALKALTESARAQLLQRHEAWVDPVRAQVDLVATGAKDAPKKVVHADELLEMLKLGRQMKAAGNESFGAKDYKMAVVRYGQVEQLLRGVRCLQPQAQAESDALRNVSVRNTSLAALKAWEWRACLRACEEVLGLQPQDHVVRLRRADALHQLGRTPEARREVSVVLDAAATGETSAAEPPADAAPPTDAAAAAPAGVVAAAPSVETVRKARRLALALLASEKRSAAELHGAVAKGLRRGTFSDARPPAPSPEAKAQAAVAGLPPAPPLGVEEPLRVKLLRDGALRRARGQEAEPLATAAASATAAAPGSQPGAYAPSPEQVAARLGRRLTQAAVAEVQATMAACFAAPGVQEELNQLRIEADFEEQRFLYRLKSLKARVLAPVLEAHAFESSEVGVREMERAVYAWMADDPTVGAKGKALTVAIMGAIWGEDA